MLCQLVLLRRERKEILVSQTVITSLEQDYQLVSLQDHFAFTSWQENVSEVFSVSYIMGESFTC